MNLDTNTNRYCKTCMQSGGSLSRTALPSLGKQPYRDIIRVSRKLSKNKKYPASRYKFFVTCSRACSITTESTLCKHSVPPCVGRVPREPCRGRRARRLIRVDPRSVQGAGFDSAGFLVRRCSLTAAPRLGQERMAYMQPAPQQAPAQTDPGEGQPAPQRMTEVENALSVLQREAGLTEDTLKVLRKAVSDNLQPRNVPGPESEGDGRKRPFKPSSSKRQQLTAEEATEVSARPPCPRPCCGPT